jgi:hypothetical protein
MSDKINKLQKLKSEIEDAKIEKIKAEQRVETILKQLKEDFGCSSLDEAEAKLNGLKIEIEKKKAVLNKGVDKLEEEYGFEEED